MIEALRDDTAEAASLAVLSECEVLFLAKATSAGALTVNHGVGTRLPAHASALGKVLPAGAHDPEQVDRVIAQRGLGAHTPRTVVAPIALRHHLAQVSARGWALDDEEFAVGLRCMAAPARDAGGEVIAAVGISGPATRVTLDRIEALALRVQRAGHDLSALLGYRAAPAP